MGLTFIIGAVCFLLGITTACVWAVWVVRRDKQKKRVVECAGEPADDNYRVPKGYARWTIKYNDAPPLVFEVRDPTAEIPEPHLSVLQSEFKDLDATFERKHKMLRALYVKKETPKT